MYVVLSVLDESRFSGGSFVMHLISMTLGILVFPLVLVFSLLPSCMDTKEIFRPRLEFVTAFGH